MSHVGKFVRRKTRSRKSLGSVHVWKLGPEQPRMNHSPQTQKCLRHANLTLAREIATHEHALCTGSAQTLAQLAFQKRIRTYTMAARQTDVKYAATGTAA
eukprot:2500316-Prymnesium_polylepis.1